MLHAITCLLGALLLFSLEPMLGKALAPSFGGGAQVWITCMLFFQVVLLLGYAWAFWIVRLLPPRSQRLLQGLLLGGALLLLLVQGARGVPFVPFRGHAVLGEGSLGVMLTLLGSCGLPFMALSTTSPVVQAWFSGTFPERSPYRLYAASNAGSLVGLLAYPFLVEPFIGLSLQAWLALGLFAVYCCLVACLGWWIPAGGQVQPEALPPPSWRQNGKYLLSSAAGDAVLMSATTFQTLHVVAIPLLWVGPLAFYLLTFILVFEGRPLWHHPRVLALALLLLALCACALASFSPGEKWKCLVASNGAVFFGGLVCHGYLHRERPQTGSLTGYYLYIAFGGVLGGLAVSLGAPLLLDRQLELGLSVALAGLVGALALRMGTASWLDWRRWVWIPALAAGGWLLRVEFAQPGLHMRDFYGTLRVRAVEGNFLLFNGGTLHGVTNVAQPEKPLSYYGPGSGAARTLQALRARQGSLKAGVIGLGVGTLGLYAQPGDAWTFFEISPAVMKVAGPESPFFPATRIMKSRPELLLGDGRRLLEVERASGRLRGFDLLVVDAFSGDSVPWYLLTVEALDLYLAHLAPEGVLAIHISNPMPLERVCLSLARARNLYGCIHSSFKSLPTVGDSYSEELGSTYILMSRRPEILRDPLVSEGLIMGFGPKVFSGGHPDSALVLAYASDAPWTDERSALSNLLFRRSAFAREGEPGRRRE